MEYLDKLKENLATNKRRLERLQERLEYFENTLENVKSNINYTVDQINETKRNIKVFIYSQMRMRLIYNNPSSSRVIFSVSL